MHEVAVVVIISIIYIAHQWWWKCLCTLHFIWISLIRN